jgi:hypothetical protein
VRPSTPLLFRAALLEKGCLVCVVLLIAVCRMRTNMRALVVYIMFLFGYGVAACS